MLSTIDTFGVIVFLKMLLDELTIDTFGVMAFLKILLDELAIPLK